MTTLDVNKSYSDLSGTVARLKAAGFSEEEIAHLNPISWEFQEAQKQAIINARVTVEEPVNVNEEEVSKWYKGARSAIQSGSRVLIMSLIELVRGLFPFIVMIALIVADGVRLYHSINLLVNENGIATLLAIVSILAYILIVYRKSEATYNFIDSNEEYEKWSIGIWLRDLRYKFWSSGGAKFKSEKMSRSEWEYRKSVSSVYSFKMLMFALIVLSPLLDPVVIKSLFGDGSIQTNFFTGQINGVADGVQAPIQIILSIFLNAFLTIQLLSMLDSNISKTYALYADRDGDQARGLGYFLEQKRQYQIRIEEVGVIAQAAYLKGRQQEAKLMLAMASQNQITASSETSLTPTTGDQIIMPSLQPAAPLPISPILRDLRNPTNVQSGLNGTNGTNGSHIPNPVYVPSGVNQTISQSPSRVNVNVNQPQTQPNNGNNLNTTNN